MQQNRPEFALHDIPLSIGLLSRIPVVVNGELAEERGAGAAWAYPVAGVAIGLIAGLVGSVFMWLGVPPQLAAGFALLAMVVATGALHEDGLADTADGLWGGSNRERRLEIMKDSRIGAYGVLALVFFVILKWAALALLFENGHVLLTMVGLAAVSRAPMVVAMQAVPLARPGGLSASQGKPGEMTALAAVCIAAFIGLVCFGWVIFWIALAIALTSIWLARQATDKIGGQTGDILGATQQIAELAILTILVIHI